MPEEPERRGGQASVRVDRPVLGQRIGERRSGSVQDRQDRREREQHHDARRGMPGEDGLEAPGGQQSGQDRRAQGEAHAEERAPQAHDDGPVAFGRRDGHERRCGHDQDEMRGALHHARDHERREARQQRLVGRCERCERQRGQDHPARAPPRDQRTRHDAEDHAGQADGAHGERHRRAGVVQGERTERQRHLRELGGGQQARDEQQPDQPPVRRRGARRLGQ